MCGVILRLFPPLGRRFILITPARLGRRINPSAALDGSVVIEPRWLVQGKTKKPFINHSDKICVAPVCDVDVSTAIEFLN
jgi:hypothetical protein